MKLRRNSTRPAAAHLRSAAAPSPSPNSPKPAPKYGLSASADSASGIIGISSWRKKQYSESSAPPPGGIQQFNERRQQLLRHRTSFSIDTSKRPAESVHKFTQSHTELQPGRHWRTRRRKFYFTRRAVAIGRTVRENSRGRGSRTGGGIFARPARGLGGLAGNAGRLGTPDRHTFPPDGKRRTPLPVRRPLPTTAVDVRGRTRARAPSTRPPVTEPSLVRPSFPSPNTFRMNGNAFRKEGHHKPWINYIFEWNVVDELAADVHRVWRRKMTMAEGSKPHFRVVEMLKIKIGECVGPSRCFCFVFFFFGFSVSRGAIFPFGRVPLSGGASARAPSALVTRVSGTTRPVVCVRLAGTDPTNPPMTVRVPFVHRRREESGQGALVAPRRLLYDHARPRGDIPHGHHWESCRVSTELSTIILLVVIILNIL